VTSRAAVLRDLETDPLARGSLAVLLGAAATALGLALLGLLLGLVADLRDESGELVDLEAQGAGPRTLERHLRLRTLLVGATAVAGGVAAGVALGTLVVRLVSLTAQATVPQPPLRLHVDWLVVALAVALYAALGALLAVVATRIAFRSRAAGRFREVGT
jgi:ABC-type antimicrobial peptide transport system permease subunit